jgi:hypothetical protein
LAKTNEKGVAPDAPRVEDHSIRSEPFIHFFLGDKMKAWSLWKAALIVALLIPKVVDSFGPFPSIFLKSRNGILPLGSKCHSRVGRLRSIRASNAEVVTPFRPYRRVHTKLPNFEQMILPSPFFSHL